MMKIYIPSRGRADQLTSGPLQDFDAELCARTIFIVPHEEVQAYKEHMPAGARGAVQVLGLTYGSIGQKRQMIAQRAANLGEGKFAMIDDDVVFSVRKSDEDWRLKRCSSVEVHMMMEHIEGLLDECASVGVSSREGNNRAGVGPPLAPNMAPRNTRIMRVLAYRTADFLACEHGRLQCMEDFDVQLQLLRRGLQNACLYYWANGQDRTNAPGGCSLWRTREIHNAAAEGLARLHPEFVRLRQKANKTDADGLGTRTEVTIAWKKAYGNPEKGV